MFVIVFVGFADTGGCFAVSFVLTYYLTSSCNAPLQYPIFYEYI